MATLQRIYHRTRIGDAALRGGCFDLSEGLICVLRTVHRATHFAEVARRLDWAEERILSRLDVLEAIGLVASVSVEWLAELDRLACYQPEPLAALR